MPALKIPGGGEVPVPGWCIPWFGVLACVVATALAYRYVNPAEPELISVKQANEQLQMTVDHYNLHIVDEPVASLADPSGAVSVRAYDDACLLVSQRIGRNSATRLLLAPADQRRRTSLTEAVFPVLEAQGRCLNPHAGRFGTGYGARVNECVVEVWRTFEDGCQHVQYLDTCRSAWDSNPDGSPRVRWTRCLH